MSDANKRGTKRGAPTLLKGSLDTTANCALLTHNLRPAGFSSFPSAAVVSPGKKVAAPYRGAWEEKKLKKFASPASAYDGLGALSSKIVITETEGWNGEDSELEYEEEFSLEDLMGDDAPL